MTTLLIAPRRETTSWDAVASAPLKSSSASTGNASHSTGPATVSPSIASLTTVRTRMGAVREAVLRTGIHASTAGVCPRTGGVMANRIAALAKTRPIVQERYVKSSRTTLACKLQRIRHELRFQAVI